MFLVGREWIQDAGWLFETGDNPWPAGRVRAQRSVRLVLVAQEVQRGSMASVGTSGQHTEGGQESRCFFEADLKVP